MHHVGSRHCLLLCHSKHSTLPKRSSPLGLAYATANLRRLSSSTRRCYPKLPWLQTLPTSAISLLLRTWTRSRPQTKCPRSAMIHKWTLTPIVAILAIMVTSNRPSTWPQMILLIGMRCVPKTSARVWPLIMTTTFTWKLLAKGLVTTIPRCDANCWSTATSSIISTIKRS